jgi:hypothetical protein
MWIFGEPNIMYAEFNWPDGLFYAVKHCFDLIFLASIQGETVGFMSFVRNALDEGIKAGPQSKPLWLFLQIATTAYPSLANALAAAAPVAPPAPTTNATFLSDGLLALLAVRTCCRVRKTRLLKGQLNWNDATRRPRNTTRQRPLKSRDYSARGSGSLDSRWAR